LRLSLLVFLCGGVIHLTLIQRVGEDHVIEMLDVLSGHWAHMMLRQKISQALLGAAMLCELLLWVDHVDWGILLIVYGMWALLLRSTRHLSIFAGVLFLSACTDSLSLATEEVGSYATTLMWILLVSKLVIFGTLVSHRDVFDL